MIKKVEKELTKSKSVYKIILTTKYLQLISKTTAGLPLYKMERGNPAFFI